MDFIAAINVLDLFMNLKGFMNQVIQDFGTYVYLVLFLIIFCETGLVFAPFLPGDSLLFLAGSLAAGSGSGTLQLEYLLPILCLAPILGDSTNYWFGRLVGPKIFHKEKVRFLNKEHLKRAHDFYQKHGGKAVAVGRFLPIIRTFVPFVAGMGKMPYARFLTFSVVGTLAWINVCVWAGYMFGNHQWVQEHFEAVIIAIVVISLVPAAVGYIRSRRSAAKVRPCEVASQAKCEE